MGGVGEHDQRSGVPGAAAAFNKTLRLRPPTADGVVETGHADLECLLDPPVQRHQLHLQNRHPGRLLAGRRRALNQLGGAAQCSDGDRIRGLSEQEVGGANTVTSGQQQLDRGGVGRVGAASDEQIGGSPGEGSALQREQSGPDGMPDQAMPPAQAGTGGSQQLQLDGVLEARDRGLLGHVRDRRHELPFRLSPEDRRGCEQLALRQVQGRHPGIDQRGKAVRDQPGVRCHRLMPDAGDQFADHQGQALRPLDHEITDVRRQQTERVDELRHGEVGQSRQLDPVRVRGLGEPVELGQPRPVTDAFR